MPDESPPNAIRPLHDVWLKPRRVFRELADKPIGAVDYLLGAAQGMVSWLFLSREQGAGGTSGLSEIFGTTLLVGPFAGIAGLYLMTAIYSALGRRAGGTSSRNQVFHVFAYSGVPLVASLVIWVFTALLAGEAAFVKTPRADTEPFISWMLQAQLICHGLLIAWSYVLQIMGFSEVEGFAAGRAFKIWVLGQVLIAVALFVLGIIVLSVGADPAGR
jgi:hypothetical protein